MSDASAFQKMQTQYHKQFVKLADVLDEMAGILREYMALPYPHVDVLAATWIAGTYCYREFQTYGYLVLRSATPRCGKTRLLKLIARLCCGNPKMTVSPTPATLFRSNRVLILDDATSSVDATTEREIKNALREVMKGRTTFVIAHRLSTIALADDIVVLEHGRVVARGDHEALLSESPLYAEIATKGLPDQVFLNRDPVERVAGL